MKIIAQINGGYLLESGSDEISNLMGFTSNYSREREKGQYNFKIGDLIPVNKMFDPLYRMANMEKELTEVSAKLKAASDFVNCALPTITHVKGEEGKPE